MKNTFLLDLFFGFVFLAMFLGCSSDDIFVPDPDDGAPVLVDFPFSIGADEYLNNRFFYLDLPARENSGRQQGEQIDSRSLRVWKYVGEGDVLSGEITNVAAYVDSNGFGVWNDMDFQDPFFAGLRWREVRTYTPMYDTSQYLAGIDFGECLDPDVILAVVYDVTGPDGTLTARVGDLPGEDLPTTILEPGGPVFYRMKLLKSSLDHIDPHVFKYVWRNIYSLSIAPFDLGPFNFKIEVLDGSENPEMADVGTPYVQIFGLDQGDSNSFGFPDGQLDWQFVDRHKALLYFPGEMPHPFAAEQNQYINYADTEYFDWDGSYLSQNLIPEIYDPAVHPDSYSQYRRFKMTGFVKVYDPSWVFSGEMPLKRIAWSWASVPIQLSGDGPYQPEDRVDDVRWFLSHERPLQRYLNPALTGAAAEETLTALDLFLRNGDDPWDTKSWGGIMQNMGPYGADLSEYSALEIWINDGDADLSLRTGVLNIDFGSISEDGFWPKDFDTGEIIVGQWEQEDGILANPPQPDGIWQGREDVGLNYQHPYGDMDGLQDFRTDYVSAADPYPYINGTAGNGREDSEDLNGNGCLDSANGCYTYAIDLKNTESAVDVVNDYDNVDDLIAEGIAWRKYVIPLSDFSTETALLSVDLVRVSHMRIWYKDDSNHAKTAVYLQLSGLKFLTR